MHPPCTGSRVDPPTFLLTCCLSIIMIHTQTHICMSLNGQSRASFMLFCTGSSLENYFHISAETVIFIPFEGCAIILVFFFLIFQLRLTWLY